MGFVEELERRRQAQRRSQLAAEKASERVSAADKSQWLREFDAEMATNALKQDALQSSIVPEMAARLEPAITGYERRPTDGRAQRIILDRRHISGIEFRWNGN